MELNLIRLSDPANGVVTKIVQKIMPRGVGVEGWYQRRGARSDIRTQVK